MEKNIYDVPATRPSCPGLAGPGLAGPGLAGPA